MSKKGNNEGSVYKDKQGRWRGVVTLYTAEGKSKKKYFYGKTKKEVTEKVNRLLSEIKTNTYIEPCKTTLYQWMNTWLDTYARNEIRLSTLVNYEIYIHKHIQPEIGHIKLCDLNTIHLQQFYNDKLKNGKLRDEGGLSPKTLRNMHNMIHKAQNQAMALGMILRNPTDPSGPRFLPATINADTFMGKPVRNALGIACRIAEYYGNRYQIIFGVHRNERTGTYGQMTSCLHIHMIINSVSFVDGRMFADNKGDIQKFVKHIKDVTRDYSWKIKYGH